jgi:23S rRNA (cytosine1962-C5)-methyltransferase
MDRIMSAESRSKSLPVPEKSSPPAAPDYDNWVRPWVQVRYWSFHPCIYKSMLGPASPDARAGNLVAVYDKEGQPFGTGLYNPKARVPLRVIDHGPTVVGEDVFLERIQQALDLRLEELELPAVTDAFRAIHSDGDGLSGLAVDRFGDVLSIEVHSLGMFQRLPQWLPHLHQRLGTKRFVLEVDEKIARMEGIFPRTLPSDAVKSVRIKEHGVRYEVNFESGHKTGFFCDQRENRRRLTSWTEGQSVLDLCCYTGGFALSAVVNGKATDVTGVDLDEKAIEQARRNANLNQVRVEWVHCDAFSYSRQVQQNGRTWNVVVLDPPKLIFTRDDEDDGARKYEDLNRLALRLIRPGGILVTCSCSGMLPAEEFERLVIRAAHKERKRLQFLDRTGPGADHPVMSNCPEGRYLKVLWARVLS